MTTLSDVNRFVEQATDEDLHIVISMCSGMLVRRLWTFHSINRKEVVPSIAKGDTK